jgi:hypothetical protein
MSATDKGIEEEWSGEEEEDEMAMTGLNTFTPALRTRMFSYYIIQILDTSVRRYEQLVGVWTVRALKRF